MISKVKIYTTDFCPYCTKAKNLLERHNIEFEEINIHGDHRMRDEIEALTGRRDVPQIFINDRHIGDDDDLENLINSEKIDTELKLENSENIDPRNVIIIGGGTAGFAAGIYTSRAMLKPLVFIGDALGGQLSMTHDLENYPGFFASEADAFIKGIKSQAERFGTETAFERVVEVDFDRNPFYLKTDGGEYLARSVIICTGSSPRLLNIPGESEYGGRGVSYCATCDGFFFQNQKVVVVGGGDAALEEGIFLTKYASEVHIVHRRDELRASKIMQERAFKNEKIHFIWNSVVEKIQGDDLKVTAVSIENVKTKEKTIFPTDGVFIFIGHTPNTDLFKGKIELDDHGYIVVDRKQQTNIKGVFAAGDVHDRVFRQAITAGGAGAAAGIMAEKFIADTE